MAAIDGLPEAVRVAAEHGFEIGVKRLAGRANNLDAWHVAFRWKIVASTRAGRRSLLIASWYPAAGVLHLGWERREAATVGQALGVLLDAIVGPGTSATAIPNRLRDKLGINGRARRLAPLCKVIGKPAQRLPPARPRFQNQDERERIIHRHANDQPRLEKRYEKRF